jgi:purine-binding chemotaxis protein CheW
MSEQKISYVTFQVDDLLLGIDIDKVQEIHRGAEVAFVPRLPAAIRGLINLRGHLVTVIDLRTVLRGEPTTIDEECVEVIVNAGGEAIGITAERLADVVDCDVDDVRPLPPHMNGSESRFFHGVVQLGDQLLVLVDVARLLDPSELETAEESVAIGAGGSRG